MSKRVLVTGGAGFVGSYVCAALRARGDVPVAFDDLSNARRENVPSGVALVEADLSDAAALAGLDDQFDAVIHCAAQSSNALSFRDPVWDYRANQLATWNVVRFCRMRGVRRLIYTSSMSVYGQPDDLPTPESSRCHPGSYYGLHKLAGEYYVRFAGDALDWTIFRLYTTYGLGQNLANREQGLIKIYLAYVLKREPLLVRGPGGRLRDVVHVSDVVNAIVGALDEPRSWRNCYNIGVGRCLTIAEIIRLILLEAGESPESYPVIYAAADPGDPHATLADTSAARRDLGWEPRVAPEEGIRMTVRAYLAAQAEQVR